MKLAGSEQVGSERERRPGPRHARLVWKEIEAPGPFAVGSEIPRGDEVKHGDPQPALARLDSLRCGKAADGTPDRGHLRRHVMGARLESPSGTRFRTIGDPHSHRASRSPNTRIVICRRPRTSAAPRPATPRASRSPHAGRLRRGSIRTAPAAARPSDPSGPRQRRADAEEPRRSATCASAGGRRSRGPNRRAGVRSVRDWTRSVSGKPVSAERVDVELRLIARRHLTARDRRRRGAPTAAGRRDRRWPARE